MKQINSFAEKYNLRTFSNWSKVWEYPWLWFNGLRNIEFKGTHICDLGSEISPIPWYFASLGAHVVLVESDKQYVPIWEKIKKATKWSVDWHIIQDEKLPLRDNSCNLVTSFSVIEHQSNKLLAIQEIARVLKTGGMFAISFDVCETPMGMSFPNWNGSALTTKEFENIIWNNRIFNQEGQSLNWNFEDSTEFIRWHLQAAPHHNYIVGAAILFRSSQILQAW